VADTCGLVILEMRHPTAEDLSGRVTKVQFTATVRTPVVADVRFDWAGELEPGNSVGQKESAPAAEFTTVDEDGTVTALLDLLVDGELTALGESAVARHEVRKEFSSPTSLRLRGAHVGNVRAISAIVGEEKMTTLLSVEAGRDGVAALVRDALSGDEV
jgi:hypothetical protein